MKTTHINIIVIILILLISFFIVKYNVKETFTFQDMSLSEIETIVNYTLRYGLYANDSSSKCGKYLRNNRVFSTVNTEENIIGEREEIWSFDSNIDINEANIDKNEAITNFMNPGSKIENLRGIVIFRG